MELIQLEWRRQITSWKKQVRIILNLHEGFLSKLTNTHFLLESRYLKVLLEAENYRRCSRNTGTKPSGGKGILEGSCPHPRRPGSRNSLTSHPCTSPADRGPGIPTPLEWSLWPHPGTSAVPEIQRTHACTLGSQRVRHNWDGKESDRTDDWMTELTDCHMAKWRFPNLNLNASSNFRELILI